MKKLILNLSLPCTFLLMSVSGNTDTFAAGKVVNETTVPAVIYKGETIPSVNLPIMIITGYKNIIKADNDVRQNKKKPIRRRPGIRATT